MTDNQTVIDRPEIRFLLPLGSVVILKGSVKKLLIVSRGSIVDDAFFDYGAVMFPEGLIDTNIAYFTEDDILKVVHEGYSDADDELVLEILGDAYARFQEQRDAEQTPASAPRVEAVATRAVADADPFANVRDLDDSDE